MKLIRFILPILLFAILITSACDTKPKPNVGAVKEDSVRKPKFNRMYPDFNRTSYYQALKTHIEEDSLVNLMYAKNDYLSIWLIDTLNTADLFKVSEMLNNAKDHGLSKDIFYAQKIDSLLIDIDNGVNTSDMSILYNKLAKLEATSAKAILKYSTGMRTGFTNPYKLFGRNYNISIATPDSAFYDSLFGEINKNPLEAFLASHPSLDEYKAILKDFKALDAIEKQAFPKIQNIGEKKVYKLGESDKNIAHIADRLAVTGEYTLDSLANDSTKMILNERLLAAVNTFRKKVNLPIDTVIESSTISELNKPLDYYKRKLIANMERYRWARLKKREAKNIEVNVPTFTVMATQPDSLPLFIKVCVGTLANKSPMLESDLAYLNLNPTWGVPTSIARGEISYKLKKDPTYLRRNNMKMYKNGKEVDPHSIDWGQVVPEKFSYNIQQGSGAGNALGRIKFMFDNRFAVYLHDTPTRRPFERAVRAVSHGCIRVEKPYQLAKFCLSPVEETYMDQLLYSVNLPPETEAGKRLLKEGGLRKLENILNIDKKEKITVFIDYRTNYLLPNDSTLYYVNDVYDFDTIILNALAPVMTKL